jgi:hypothetical protein
LNYLPTFLTVINFARTPNEALTLSPAADFDEEMEEVSR